MDQQPDGRHPPSTGEPILARCGACGVDLSTVTLGGWFPTPRGPVLVLLSPLRCPDCHAPLFYRGTVALPGLS